MIVSTVRSMSMPAAAATAFGPGWVGGGWAPEPAWDTAAATMGPGCGLGGVGAKSIPGGWIQYPVRGFIPRLF
jgi:hypothetical protein